jgi:heme exporter protein A
MSFGMRSNRLASMETALPPLQLIDLACRRGERLLFRGVSLELRAGQAVWLRGCNGRGKTSLLRLVTGLARPACGQVLWGGEPVRRSSSYRHRLVHVGHAAALKDELTVAEALGFLARLHGRDGSMRAVRAALARLGVEGRADATVRSLSQGQRKRVALARLALEERAGLWLLDEPFDGLDTDAAERLDDLLDGHLARGGSLLLASHLPFRGRGRPPAELDLDRHAGP